MKDRNLLRNQPVNLKSVFGIIATLVGSIVIGSEQPAQAFNFTTGAVGGSCQSLTSLFSIGLALESCETGDGFQLFARGGWLEAKEKIDATAIDDGYQGSVTGVGVSSSRSPDFGICMIGVISPCNGNYPVERDAVPGEINFNESIDLVLPNGGGVLKSLDLAFLFQPQNSPELIREFAIISSNLPNVSGRLTVQNENTAIWEWQGKTTTISALSNSTQNPQGGGWYSIPNPFGNTLLTQVTLTASNQEDDSLLTDYSLVGAEVHHPKESVPEPGVVLGLGFVALVVGASRRRRHQQS